MFGIILGGLASFLQTINVFESKLDEHNEEKKEGELKLDKAFSIKWGNEDCVNCPLDSHYIEMTLEASQGYLRGVIDTRRVSDDAENIGISIDGRREGVKAILTASKTSYRGTVDLGKFEIELIQMPFEDSLEWRLIDDGNCNGCYPSQVTLFPH